MKKEIKNILVILVFLPFVMSMTCTHTPPVSPSIDAAVTIADAQPPTPIDGAVPPQTCGISTALIDDVSNSTFLALQDATNSQSKLNTLANQFTRPSIVCLVNKIVAGTPNAPASLQRAKQWLGASTKK
jgi:hypothetical protein